MMYKSGIRVKLFGSDQRIVRAARVSFNKDSEVNPERDKKLIHYLFTHKHASPFEHCIIAYTANRNEYFDLIACVDNPAVPIYFDSGYIFMTLRSAFNAWEHLETEVKIEIEKAFPAAVSVFLGRDHRLSRYSTDENFILQEVTVDAGKIALVDKLELGTRMDYYTFLVECPIFVARQWHRHRFGSYNEVSRRYTSVDIKFYFPKNLRLQDKVNRQASTYGEVPNETEHLDNIYRISEEAFRVYNRMVSDGVARELARMVLPQNLMTRFYWTVPRIALDNFIALRTHEGAQKEIREFAEAIKDMVGYNGLDKTLTL